MYADSGPGMQRPRPCQRRSSISRWIHFHFRSTRFCFRFRLAVLFGSGSPLLARIGGKQRTLRAIDAKSKCRVGNFGLFGIRGPSLFWILSPYSHAYSASAQGAFIAVLQAKIQKERDFAWVQRAGISVGGSRLLQF